VGSYAALASVHARRPPLEGKASTMTTESRRLLWVLPTTVLITLGLAALVWYFWLRPGGGYGQKYAYEYGRPLRADETSYAKYKAAHMDAAKVPAGDRDAAGGGMDTWYWWTAGSEGFWRDVAVLTDDLGARVDLLAILHTVPRSERWKMMGLVNDPDCVAAEKPDKYGLLIDRMKEGTADYDYKTFGWSSGVIGLRLFENPNFKPEKWNFAKYLQHPKDVEPPYRVGMTCAVCHVALNPCNPPEDAAEPKWDNLASVIGNQYFEEPKLFQGNFNPDQFVWHYANSQQPGTSETSRFDTDFVNNPNAINSIYRLSARLKLHQAEQVSPAEKALLEAMPCTNKDDFDPTGNPPTLKVAHVLKDGSDSMGLPVASLRVWVNIGGMDHKQWMSCWALTPDKKRTLDELLHLDFQQKPFDIKTVRTDPNGYWRKSELRMAGLEAFLKTCQPYPLAQAKEFPAQRQTTKKDGKDYLTAEADTIKKGKIAFADKCARCHSSKTPPDLPKDPGDAEGAKKAWEAFVLRDDFLDDNYLSDDARHPVSELHTNAARALATNALQGHLWEQFSSETYKTQSDAQARGDLKDEDSKDGSLRDLYDPLKGTYSIKFSVPADRVASYRTPTLVSVWATAPYLHNNSVGIYNKDPSVAGRMAAFNDGMHKLLWPERRLGVLSVKRTSCDSVLTHPLMLTVTLRTPLGHPLTMPAGTPVNLLGHLHPKDVPAVIDTYEKALIPDPLKPLQLRYDVAQQAALQKMLEVSPCPDFIEDKGHTYGRDLKDDEKEALIEFLKTF
jgi:hypothetical protein